MAAPAIPPDTLTQWLAEARAALHQLEIGKAKVRLMIEGELVEYQRADRQTLRAYIASLESQLNGAAPRSAIRITL